MRDFKLPGADAPGTRLVAYGGALTLTPAGWCWTDTGDVEPLARTVTVGDLVPAVPRLLRYGVPLALVSTITVDGLPDPVRERIRATLARHGRCRLMPAPGLDRARTRLQEVWTIRADLWAAALATPIACELVGDAARGAVERAARWHEATLDAARVECAIASTLRRWYATPRRYAEREAAAWAHVLDVLLERREPGSPAFWRAEKAAFRLTCDDLLTMFDDELAALAEAVAAMNP